jgi:hypothetical protein
MTAGAAADAIDALQDDAADGQALAASDSQPEFDFEDVPTPVRLVDARQGALEIVGGGDMPRAQDPSTTRLIDTQTAALQVVAPEVAQPSPQPAIPAQSPPQHAATQYPAAPQLEPRAAMDPRIEPGRIETGEPVDALVAAETDVAPSAVDPIEPAQGDAVVSVDPVPPAADEAATPEQTAAASDAPEAGEVESAVPGLFDPLPATPATIADPAQAAANAVARDLESADDKATAGERGA